MPIQFLYIYKLRQYNYLPFMCNCVCILLKNNSEEELKLLHFTLNVCLQSQFTLKTLPPVIKPGRQVQTNKKLPFTFCKQMSTSKESQYSLLHSAIRELEKPLQSLHMAWLFLAQKLEQSVC